VLGLAVLALAVTAAVFLYVRGPGSGPPEEALEAALPADEGLAPGQPPPGVTAEPEEPAQEAAARESIPVEVAGPSGCVYVVRDPDERPVVDAPFVLFEPGNVLLAGRTDQRGEIGHEESGEGAAGLLVLAPDSAPQILEAPRAQGRHELALERGAVISGHVVVDGRAPVEPIELTAICDRPLLAIEDALGLTWEEAQLDDRSATRIESGTRADGAFRFYGLAADWSGVLRVPRRYRLADRSLSADPWGTSLALERPVEGLLVELTRPLRILGRVVQVEGGDPVPDAFVYPKLVYADESTNRQWLDDVRADEEGRFALVLENPHVRGESLTVCPPGHQVERVVPIEPRDLSEDWDLGDIPLRVPHGSLELALLVQDRAGEPIQGAVATTMDASSRPSAPTGEDGRTVLEGLAEGPTLIRALAIGYEIAEVPAVVAPEGGELVVTLRRGTLLRLRFLAPDGRVMRSVRCAITTSEYPFRRKITWPLESQLVDMGASIFSPLVRGEGVTHSFTPAGEERTVVINGIQPGLAMQLLVVSRTNTILVERELAPLGEEEHRDEDIDLDRVPRTLRGRVVDEQGQPLAQASAGIDSKLLDLSYHGGQSFSRSLDEDGGFEFPEIFAERVSFHARCDGYIPFRDAELEVPSDETPIEIVLAKGREALVIVEDEKGRAIEAAVVASLPGGAVALSRTLKKGHYMLHGLPDAAVTVTAMLEQTHHRKELGARDSELRITLPVAGRVEGTVTMPPGLEPDARCRVWLVPEDGQMYARWSWTPSNEPGTRDFSIEHVLPGRYKAVVRRQDLSRIPEVVYEDVGGHVWIEVESERTTRVELRP